VTDLSKFTLDMSPSTHLFSYMFLKLLFWLLWVILFSMFFFCCTKRVLVVETPLLFSRLSLSVHRKSLIRTTACFW